MTHLKIGDKAPSFLAIDQAGKVHQLSDYLGKRVVLYFYPKDNTPACINQACNLRDHAAVFQEKALVVLGVSMDTQLTHEKFDNKHRLGFPLLVDSDRGIIDAYGIWGPKKFMGREYDGIHRTTFLIDEAGIILHIITKPKTKVHSEEILNWLEQNVNSLRTTTPTFVSTNE